jgi:DNA repair photolyase
MIKNISVIRGCRFDCIYCCVIRNPFYLSTNCEKCRNFIPHSHINILDRSPPKTDELITVGISSDVSFSTKEEMNKIISYFKKWNDRNFVVISKNPEFFLKYKFPENVILGTTIETNKYKEIGFDYTKMSRAPSPEKRIISMQKLKKQCINKFMVIIEPIMIFDLIPLVEMIKSIEPYEVRIGYDKFNYNLSEPSIEETEKLILELKKFTNVVKMHM